MQLEDMHDWVSTSTLHSDGWGVHGLGKPKKPVKPTQKNPKKWVGLGDWVDMVLKNEKPIKKIMGFG